MLKSIDNGQIVVFVEAPHNATRTTEETGTTIPVATASTLTLATLTLAILTLATSN